MSTSDPLETLHNIESGRYSINTVLKYLEFLDARDTMREDVQIQAEKK